MQIHRRLALAAVCAAALGLAATSSASAARCITKTGSKKYSLCVGGESVGEELRTASTVTNSSLVAELGTLGGTIKCTSGHTGAVRLFRPGTGNLKFNYSPEIAFEGCTLEGALSKKCALEKSQHFEFGNEGEFIGVDSAVMFNKSGLLWTALASNVGAEKCALHHMEFYGQYECKIANASIEAVEHQVTCTSAREALYVVILNGEQIPLKYTQTIALSGAQLGKKFSIYEA